MMPEELSPKACEDNTKSTQIRVGLVLYGGVSLAIYINGVAQEFFRAVRGRNVYKWVKALTDSDIVVDIISGTSAGGVNGILLAYALCNDKEFSASSTLWRRDGDIRNLLRSPNNSSDFAPSLLDSEGYYHARLEDAFRYMPQYVSEQDEITSQFKELDLFVTGTNIDGNIYTQFDDAGHAIDVKDHRSVFHLKHRQGRKEPFNALAHLDETENEETTYSALAKLARITSCFPAAFAPVSVSKGDTPEDVALRKWGSFGNESSFLDGGVIDNKPFTHTLREIFYRSADTRVDRKLFYVEPDPEHFVQPETATTPNFLQAIIASLVGIPSYESISDDLKMLAQHNSRITQYKRFVSRLTRTNLNDVAPRHVEDIYLQSRIMALGERVVEGVLKVNGKEELLSLEMRRAASALVNNFDDRTKEMPQEECRAILDTFDVYFRLRRLFSLVYFIGDKLNRVLPAKQKAARDLLRAHFESNMKLPGDRGYDSKVLNHVGDTKIDCAIDFLNSYSEIVSGYRSLWRAINRQLELLEILRIRMEGLMDDLPIDWKRRLDPSPDQSVPIDRAAAEIWDCVIGSLRKLLNENEDVKKFVPNGYAKSLAREEWPNQQELSSLNNKLIELATAITNEVRVAEEDKKTISVTEAHNLFNMTYRYERSLIEEIMSNVAEPAWESEDAEAFDPVLDNEIIYPDVDPGVVSGIVYRNHVLQRYVNFIHVDVHLFPIEMVSGLYEKDIIEAIRISPRDAEKGFSNKGLSDKVSGDALYHFGGFFKRSWRSNDILWGRLDGLCQIVESLLSSDRLKETLASAEGRLRVLSYFSTDLTDEKKIVWQPEMDPLQLFPRSGVKTQNDLKAWIEDLLVGDDDARKKGLGEKYNDMICLLIEAAQLEVIGEELPNVVTDALAEQAQWNQFRLTAADREQMEADAGRKNNGPIAARSEKAAVRTDPFRFEAAAGSLDPFAAILAAAGRVKTVMRSFDEDPNNPPRPSRTELGRFFINQYQVGAEKLLRDMPLLVLLEILSVSLLVLRSCIVGLFGENAAKVKNSPLYLLVEYPLRTFHAIVVFLRRAPNSWVWFQTTVLILSSFSLALGFLFWDSMFYDANHEFTPWRFLILMLIPFTILLGQSIYSWRNAHYNSWPKRIAAFLVALLLAVSLVGSIGLTVVAANRVITKIQGEGEQYLRSLRLFELPFMSSLAHPLAQHAISIAILITLFFSTVAVMKFANRSRVSSKKLKQVLTDFYSSDELKRLADRMMAPRLIPFDDAMSKLDAFIKTDSLSKRVRSELKNQILLSRDDAESVLETYLGASEIKLIKTRICEMDTIHCDTITRDVKCHFDQNEVPVLVEKRLRTSRHVTWSLLSGVLEDYFEVALCADVIAKLRASGKGGEPKATISQRRDSLDSLINDTISEIRYLPVDPEKLAEKARRKFSHNEKVKWGRLQDALMKHLTPSEIVELIFRGKRDEERTTYEEIQENLGKFLEIEQEEIIKEKLNSGAVMSVLQLKDELGKFKIGTDVVTRGYARELQIIPDYRSQNLLSQRKAIINHILKEASDAKQLSSQMRIVNPEVMYNM